MEAKAAKKIGLWPWERLRLSGKAGKVGKVLESVLKVLGKRMTTQ